MDVKRPVEMRFIRLWSDYISYPTECIKKVRLDLYSRSGGLVAGGCDTKEPNCARPSSGNRQVSNVRRLFFDRAYVSLESSD